MSRITADQYDRIVERVAEGGTLTFEEFKQAVRFMRWDGVHLYRTMTVADWLTTVEDLMDAIKG